MYFYYFKSFNFRKISYFLVCNAKKDDEKFNRIINFDEYLIPHNWNIEWIEEEIDLMPFLINNDQIPEPNLSCKNFAYPQ